MKPGDLMIRPLASEWPKPVTSRPKRLATKADLPQMLRDLEAELDYLKVRDAKLELDFAPADFRKTSGLPFQDSRPRSAKVMLTFHLPDVGLVLYACDRFREWWQNLRAISLTLTALRAVDRYEAATGKEQYRGFKALPGAGETGGDGAGAALSPEEAAIAILNYIPSTAPIPAEGKRAIAGSLLGSAELARVMIRDAIKATHPDQGGERKAFEQVQRARRALTDHFAEDV